MKKKKQKYRHKAVADKICHRSTLQKSSHSEYGTTKKFDKEFFFRSRSAN